MTRSAATPRPFRTPSLPLVLSPAIALALAALLPAAALAEDTAAVHATTDAVSQLIVALVIVGVFVLLTLEWAHRVLVVLAAVGVLWAVTYLTPWHLAPFETAWQAIDLNVLLLLGAMMAVVGVLKTTGVFEWAVARIMTRAGNRPGLLMRVVAWFTGIVSAFADNVTTVIFVTPMAGQMARRFGIRPAAFLLPMVMAANIGGTATLIGDPPNIMIGSGARLDFMAFLANLTVPVAVMMFALEWFSLRYYSADLLAARGGAVAEAVERPPIGDPRLLRWALVICALIFVGFFTHGLTHMPAAVPAVIGAAALLVVQDRLYIHAHRPSHAERVHGLLDIIQNEIEWPTLLFFTFLFIAVGAAVATGLIESVARALLHGITAGSAALGFSARGELLFAALVILWVSGVLSAFIDNIPYVAVAIPIVARLVERLPGETTVLWWALALGACLGGNGTAVGASANVTVIGLAEKAGTRIAFAEFTAYGARVTGITLLIASAYVASDVYMGARRAHLIWWLLLAALLLVPLSRRLAGTRWRAAARDLPSGD